MTLHKLAIAALISIALSGCFHTQLKGSVGGSSLTITMLRGSGEIHASGTSGTADELREKWGEEKWLKKSAFVKLLFTGISQPNLDGIDPQTLYLVRSSGGMDYDPELNQGLSSFPVPVQGSWHAIATGQRILDGNLKVSALSEALYRQLESQINEWSDEEVLSRLDAASQLIVGDVDESGSVDYDDVLRWNRSLDADFFLGNLNAVDQLSGAIIAGQPVNMIASKARNVLGKHRVVMEFDVGTVLVETLNWDSPVTVANFLTYVQAGYYDQMLVHRAINNFMIQMGLAEFLGRDENDLVQWGLKSAGPSIANESSNGLSNLRGTLSMARTRNPDSATSQFFINQVNNTHLDGSFGSADGYAVFARVLEGMETVDEIAAERTVYVSGIGDDVPARGVVLNSVRLQ